MKSKKASPALVRKWALKTQPTTGGTDCWSCRMPPEAVKAEALIVKLSNEGKSNASCRQIRDYLIDTFGVKLPNGTSYWRHLKDHRNWRPRETRQT